MTVNIKEVKVIAADGQKEKLGKYAGNVLLIVNVASKCGFTKQYEGLQALQNLYEKKGFQILGFPCNDFGGQEPGSINEIKAFCTTNFSITFKIFEKIHAKGNTSEPYTTLIQSDKGGDVEWNFEKFLISKEGNVIKRFKSGIEPTSKEIKNAIEDALNS